MRPIVGAAFLPARSIEKVFLRCHANTHVYPLLAGPLHCPWALWGICPAAEVGGQGKTQAAFNCLLVETEWNVTGGAAESGPVGR